VRAATVAACLSRDGYVVVDGVVDAAGCDRLVAALDRHGTAIAPRDWLAVAAIAQAARDLLAAPALAPLLPEGAMPWQCTLFDKAPGHDWTVGPHQDLSVPAACLADAACADAPRVVKDGVAYVQPPADVLASLLAVRLQLDDVAADAGALEVVAGTHRRGRLDEAELRRLGGGPARVRVGVGRGGVVALRPLLVHASRRLRAPVRRRVLHFVFGPGARRRD
jgi:ectoine hydroxylase-related dioxygenase (phytanoyl-CoA dioxygenase family)